MKRSEINAIIRHAEEYIAAHKFLLPPFAHWSPEAWRAGGEELAEIRRAGLGWDITDFGQGDFRKAGLVLITLRNGDARNLDTGRGMVYAEKIIVVREGQIEIAHYHKVKTEDIIVRGGAPVTLRLHYARPDGELDRETPVRVPLDGLMRTVEAGGTVTVQPGASITLEAGVVHEFWSEGGDSLLGEVSTVNDDKTDNYFFVETARFPPIEEDEPPYRLIVPDYIT